MVAINEWLSYFNVRLNYLQIFAGQETVISLKPTRIRTSDSFGRLSVEKRGCLYRTENLSEVKTYSKSLKFKI